MAYNNYNKIEYKDVDYYMRDSRVFLIKSTHPTPTNNWTGSFPEGIDNYTDLGVIDFMLQRDSNGDDVTLNIGSYGAKTVYLSHKNEPVTDEFEAGSIIRIAYVDVLDAWKVVGSDASGSGGGGSLDVEYAYLLQSASLTGGSQASLSYTTKNQDGTAPSRIKGFTKNTPTEVFVSDGVLTLKNGTQASISYEKVDVSEITGWTANTLQGIDNTDTVRVVKNVEMVEPEE